MAGFVGTSNLLTGDGRRGRSSAQAGTFTVRPEKIRLGRSGRPPSAPDEASASGTIREVVYLGPDTRYIVALDAGGELVVTQQNLATSSMEALAAQGRAVRLIWKRQHDLPVADGRAGGRPAGEGGTGLDRQRDSIGCGHDRAIAWACS